MDLMMNDDELLCIRLLTSTKNPRRNWVLESGLFVSKSSSSGYFPKTCMEILMLSIKKKRNKY